MCGFVGIFNKRTVQTGSDLSTIKAMAEMVRHRGPDDEGYWSDPLGRITLGFKRLSIVDLSADGHQPMSSHDGRLIVAFNGEIYNHRRLRRELEGHGHRFRGGSDTE